MYKCYECDPPPCKKGATKTIEFMDQTEAEIFQHSGSLDIHQLGKKVINFGLLSDYTSHHPIHAGLGLGPPIGSIEPYTPILKQLEDVLPSTSFSLYLKPGNKPSGQLILGGQDPSLYQDPLFTFNLDEHYGLELTGFRVGDDSYPKDEVKDRVEIDIGAEAFFVPQWALIRIIDYLQTRGSREVEITEVDEIYEVLCDDVKYLPPLIFLLKDSDGEDVPLVLTPEVYVLPPPTPDEPTCSLTIAGIPVDPSADVNYNWFIGCNVLLGKYVYFDYEQKMIGFASLKT